VTALTSAGANGLTTGLRRFNHYPEYQDSTVGWLGEIPAHWQVRRFRHCCSISEGQVDPRDNRFNDHVLVAPNHIESGTGRLLFTQTAEEQGAISGKYLVRQGEIIYSKIRPALNKACIAQGYWLCSADMYPIRVERLVNPHYLLYFLLSEPFVRLMVDESMRVAMPKVNREALEACPILVPPASEQRDIIAFLDRETAKIEALVAKKERLFELLQEKRAALITHVVTKGLDPTVPMKNSGIQWLAQIPAHWTISRLMHLTPDRRPIMYGIVLPGPNVDDGVPIVKGGDVAPGRLRLDSLNRTTREIEADYVRSRLRGGDVVYAIRGSIGAVEIAPSELEGANLTQDAARVAPRPGVNSRWLLYALKSRAVFAQLDAGALGATIRGINIRDLKRAVLPVPPVEEQALLASSLDRQTGRIDGLIAKVREHIEKLREYRTALISAAVTGKIDIRADIPAESRVG
jgi:type I restriction enzyme S subunit